jgi:nucleoid DNA-binding protein
MRKKFDNIDDLLGEELVSQLCELEDIPTKEARRRIKNIIWLIRKSVAQDSTVRVPKLGHFYVTHRKCKFRNKKTGILEESSNVGVIKFRPADSFKSEVNSKIRSNNFNRIKKNVR